MNWCLFSWNNFVVNEVAFVFFIYKIIIENNFLLGPWNIHGFRQELQMHALKDNIPILIWISVFKAFSLTQV